MPIRSAKFDIEPRSAAPPHLSAARTIEIDLARVAACAMHEVLQTGMGNPHLAGLLGTFLAPPDAGDPAPPWLRWRGRGVGTGTEMRRGMSHLLGRFFARWYLTEHAGMRFFKPIDGAPCAISSRLVVSRTSGALLPDWLCAGDGGIILGESKGSMNASVASAASAPPLQAAKEQIELTQIHVRDPATRLWRPRAVKGWAVMSRWASQQDSLFPLLYVLDPSTEGEPLEASLGSELAVDVARAHYRSLLRGMGLTALADRVFPRPSVQVDQRAPFGSVQAEDDLDGDSPDERPLEIVGIGDVPIGGDNLLGVVVNGGGVPLGITVAEAQAAIGSLPEAVVRNLLVVGLPSKVLATDNVGRISLPMQVEAMPGGAGAFPGTATLPDGFTVAPLRAVSRVARAEPGLGS